MSDWRAPKELPDLRRVGMIGLDTETKDDRLRVGMGSGWPFGQGYICGISVAYSEGGTIRPLYFPIRHPDSDNFDPAQVFAWLKDLIASDVRIATQNGLYDWGWLRADGGILMPPSERLEEIGALATLVDENRYQYSLDALCAWGGLPGKNDALLVEAVKALGVKVGTRKNRPQSHIWRLPAHYVGPYAEADAANTLALWDSLNPVLDREATRGAYRLEVDLLPMVHEMRRRGIRVDTAAAERARDLLLQKRDAVFAELSDKLGASVGMEEIGRTAWLAATFDRLGIKYPSTEKGAPSFTAGITGWMPKHSHWLPQLIVKADKYNNAAANVLQGYILGHVVNGRIHAEIHPHRGEANGTKSFRFSYSDPPLQLMPSRDEALAPLIRGVFLPEEGEFWAKPDASQQEFRLVVHYANQHRLRKAADAAARYRDDPDADFHALAATLTGLERTAAKAVNFAKIYGAGVRKFAAMIGKSQSEAERLYQQYDRELPFLRTLSQIYTRQARTQGYITLYDGARRHFNKFAPGGKWEKGAGPCEIEQARERLNDPDHPWYHRGPLHRVDTHTALNALIQGSAARHTKMWMRACWREGIVPLLQMHDCLDCSVSSREQGELVARLGCEAVQLDVPMRVDLKFGRSWGDAKHTWAELHQSEEKVKTPELGIGSGLNVELAAADADNPAPTQHDAAAGEEDSLDELLIEPVSDHNDAGDGRRPWASTPTVIELIGLMPWTIDPINYPPPPPLSAPPPPLSAPPPAKPNGHGGSKICCPFHTDRTPSLQLYSDGHYHCFGCGAHGAIDELPDEVDAPISDAAPAATLEQGLALWQVAKPIGGTPAERYLVETRKLDLAMLSDLGAVLRFHPHCPFDGARHPCLVALFRDADSDAPAGIHRIALTADADKIGRMMLGSWPYPRAIKLRAGGAELIIGEGIETTIAGGMVLGRPTAALWAMGSARAIGHLQPIAGIERLTVLVDRERSGVGIDNARRCATRWRDAGREVTLLIPHHDDADFNDLIRSRAP
jgi:DNA polymerase I-like protein with 3'-5' exonuclease and polymerase domains